MLLLCHCSYKGFSSALVPLPCLLCPPPLLYMRAEFKTEFHLRGCYFFPFPDLKKEKEAPFEKFVTAIHPYETLQGFC